MKPSLPLEVWICIAEHATFVDGELETQIYDPLRCPTQIDIQRNINENLPTSANLVLVSKFFHAIATRHLYRSITINSLQLFTKLMATLKIGVTYNSQPLKDLILRIDMINAGYKEDRSGQLVEINLMYTLTTNLRLFVEHDDFWDSISPINPHFFTGSPSRPYPKEFQSPETASHRRVWAPKLRVFCITTRRNYSVFLQPSLCFMASHPLLNVHHQSTTSMVGNTSCFKDGHWGLHQQRLFPGVNAITGADWDTERIIFPNLKAITFEGHITSSIDNFCTIHDQTVTIIDLSFMFMSSDSLLASVLDRFHHLTTLVVSFSDNHIGFFHGFVSTSCPNLDTVVLTLHEPCTNPPILYRDVSEHRMDVLMYILPISIPTLERIRFWHQYLRVPSMKLVEQWVEEMERIFIRLEGFDGSLLTDYLRRKQP